VIDPTISAASLPPRRSSGRLALVLTIGVLLPLFLQLGGRGLNEPDEGRYAEIARVMAVTGDWVVPRLHGRPHWAKPPLTYWLVGLSMRTFGLSEWSARLVPALAACATCLGLFSIVRRSAGAAAGVWSAVVLASMLEFFVMGRTLTTDMLVAASVTWAMAAFWRIREAVAAGASPPATAQLVFWIMLGLGFLAKGHIPFVVVMLAVLGYSIASRSWAAFRALGWTWGMPLFLVIGLSWFALAVRREPRLLDFYLGRELRDRVLSGNNRRGAWWLFFAVLPIGAWPWTAAFVEALWRSLRARETGRDPVTRPLEILAIAWIAVPLCLFTSSSSKLYPYVLPLFAPMAALVGLRIAAASAGRAPLARWVLPVTWMLLPAAFAAAVFVKGLARHPWRLHFLAATTVLTLGTCLAARWASRQRPERRVAVAAAGILFAAHAGLQGLLALLPAIETDFNHNSCWREIAQGLRGIDVVGAEIPRRLRPDPHETLSFPDDGVRLVNYRLQFSAGELYLLRERAEYIPELGSSAGWEMREDESRAPFRSLADLGALLREPRPTIVIAKALFRERIEEAAGRPLAVAASIGKGKRCVLALANAAYSAAAAPALEPR
jgi:4-amino-4-deoxy-L-arabinose transferase-like glycosyltransferase